MVSRPAKIVLTTVLCLWLSATVWAQGKISRLQEFVKGAETTVEPAERPAEEVPAEEGAQPAEAERQIPEKAAETTPDQLAAQLSQAEEHYQRGRYAAARNDAVSLWNQVERLSKEDQKRVVNLLKKVEDAIDERRERIREKISEEMARTRGPEEKLTEADRLLEKERERIRVQQELYRQLALDHFKAGEHQLYTERNYDKAIGHFRDALQLNPDLTEAERGIKIAKAMRGGPEARAAEEDIEYEEMLRRAKAQQQYQLQQYQNMVGVADRLYEAGKYTEALASYRRAQTLLNILETRMDMRDERARLERAIAQAQQEAQAAAEARKEKELIETRERMKETMVEQQREQIERGAELIERVMALMREKEFEKATGIVLEMLYEDPGDRSARMLLQKIARERHDYVMSKMNRRHERELLKVLEDTAERFVPYRELVRFPERKVWREQIDPRSPVDYPSRERELTPEERKVYEELEKPITIDFTDTPLPDVLAFFREVRNLNITLDRASLPEDLAPVTLKMSDVPLKTALKEILEPHRMSYAVEGNVIKVARKDKLEQYELRVYDVADLLLNFEDKISSSRGLSLASQTGDDDSGGWGDDDDDDDDDDGESESIRGRANSLARLISRTVRPETWAQVGVIGGPTEEDDDDDEFGLGEEEFGLGEEDFGAEVGAPQAGRGRIIIRGGRPGDMVILQTPEVHSEVEELLRALRQASTIQVQIDARFVTVGDSWLEDIGFQINNFQARSDSFAPVEGDDDDDDDSSSVQQRGRSTFMSPTVGAPTTIVLPDGRIGVGLGDGSAVPFMGTGTSPDASEPYGVNVYFSIFDKFSLTGFFKALQSATESETLSAPRVTLTNAQRGYITVGTQTNYVASFEAEGDIATPEIETIDDSVSLDVRPVVSADRKYVYLELAPFVRTVIDIQTFEFANQQTGDDDDDAGGVPVTTRIQLPIQAVQEVETTVMVPDRGVLTIGGLSTLSSVQVQNGVPLLSKIPILKRFFSNDRQTRARRNLLILVRPQIIIMEEEKNRQL